MFDDTWFMALVDDKPAGYLLCFVRDRDAYCTTLAIREEFQRTRVTPQRLAAFVQNIIEKVDVCWFTVRVTSETCRRSIVRASSGFVAGTSGSAFFPRATQLENQRRGRVHSTRAA